MPTQWSQGNPTLDPSSAEALTTMGALLGTTLHSEADVLRIVEAGVPVKTYARVVRHLGLPKGTIAAETTMRRRMSSENGRLTPDESERLINVVRAFALAGTFFRDMDQSRSWQHQPARYLPDRAPMAPVALAMYSPGVRLLEDRILRTAHGMF